MENWGYKIKHKTISLVYNNSLPALTLLEEGLEFIEYEPR